MRCKEIVAENASDVKHPRLRPIMEYLNEVDTDPYAVVDELYRIAFEVSVNADATVNNVIGFAFDYGGIDGAHHKQWVIDQIIRKLAGNRYEALVKEACDGEDGPQTFTWDEGIAP